MHDQGKRRLPKSRTPVENVQGEKATNCDEHDGKDSWGPEQSAFGKG